MKSNEHVKIVNKRGWLVVKTGRALPKNAIQNSLRKVRNERSKAVIHDHISICRIKEEFAKSKMTL